MLLLARGARPATALLRHARPAVAVAQRQLGLAAAPRAAAAGSGAKPAQPAQLPVTKQLVQTGDCSKLAALLPSAVSAGELDAALLAAARLGCSAELRSVLSTPGVNPCCSDPHGIAPLHLAAAAGSEDCVSQLLAAGAAPDQRDKLQRTPAMLCVLRGHGSSGVMRQLVAAGASVHSCCAYGHTPLILAGAVGDAPAVRQLLELGSDPFRTDSSGLTPRAAAARRSAKEVLPDEADELAQAAPGEPGGPDFAAVERMLEAAEREWHRQQGADAQH